MLIHHWLRTLTARPSGRRRSSAIRSDVNCVRRAEALETRTMLTAPNPLALGGLDGATGFRIDGVQTSDSSGRAVSNAGDVNGDGYEDVIIGAPIAGGGAGRTYVVFGGPNAFNSSLSLADLNGTNGFRINGITAGDNAGSAVSGAGDFNGDGLADLLIGAPNASPSGQTRAGEAFIVFGRTSFGSSLNLSSLNGTTGVRLSSLSPYNVAGRSVGAVGDINGDGFDDLAVGGPDITGSYSGTGLPGRAFVLFGHSTPFSSTLDFDSLDGSNGFTLNGTTGDDYSGSAVSAAGDVNGDGIADLLVGASGTSSEAGSAYVIFGKTSAFASSIGLDTLNGTNGFRLDGPTDSRTGIAASGAGDINGDGLDDLVIGSPAVPYSGDAFVVFGRTSFSSVQQLASLSSANGFRITGSATGGYHGIAVSATGDVNGDGFDDILTGAYRATASGQTYAGESYVIFGQSSSFGSTFSLSNLDGTNGFRLTGTSAYDASGQALGGGADINGDGFDDLLVGAYGANPNSVYDAGVTYLVFGAGFTAGAETRIGTTSADTLTATRGTAADVLIGGRGHDTLVGDGGADVLIGGQGNDQLQIASSAFQRVDGGTGIDSLRLAGQNMSLNLTTIPDNRIHDIEEIDLTQAGVNTLTLNSREVLNASGTSNTLVVRRDSGDTVNVGDFGSPVGSETINAEVFDVYQRGQAILKVQNTLAGVRVQVSPGSLQEGTGASLVYTFTRPDTAGSLTINFTVSGTATLSSDYTQAGATTFTSSTGTITLADGVASRGITVAAVNDTLVEGDETLTLTISSSANYIIGSPQSATGTIRDNDTAVVSFTSASSSLAENSATPASIGVTVLLSANGVVGAGSLANDITVNVFDRGTGTATPSTDFTFTNPTTLTFAESDFTGGMATATVSLSALNDTLVEGLETVDLGLGSVSTNATINTAADDHTLTLTDNDTAELSFSSATSTVVEDAGTHAVSVQLLITANGTAGTGSIGNAVSVQVDQLTTGTALALSDFTFSDPTTLTFASGTASGATRSALITLINDTVVEGSESINFALINALNAGINTAVNNHTVTITDNDTATVSFSSATGNIAENVSGGNGRVGVTLTITANGVTGSGSLSADVTVDVSDAGTGTATSGAGNDYQFTSPATLTFASALVSGTATSNATLTINNDTIIEAPETIALALSNVTGPAVAGATTTHTATIVDNDTAVVSFEAASSSVLENDPTGTFSIPVTLVLSANGVTGSGTLENDITVNIDDLRTGTAAAGGTDYTFTDPTTLTFPASTSGAATQSATITLNNDTAVEENETINFVLNTLSTPATVGTNGAHSVTILDDDSPLISVSVAPSTASEAGGILTYTFTRGGNTASAATVVFTLTGTAASGDYAVTGDASLSGSNGTVIFGGGETTKTLRLTAVNDTVVEGDETAIVTLTEGAQYNLASPSTATGTIVDNDTAVVAFASGSASVSESGGSSSVGVSLIVTANGVANSGTIQNTVTVNVEDQLTGTATSGSDYTFSSPAVISFPAGSSSTSRTVTIPVIDDDIVERNETVALALTTVTGGASINTGADDHTLTITNDDTATLTITDVAVDEGASGTGTMSFNVRLDNEVDTSLTVRFATSNGTATAGSDYVSATGTLTFAGSAGEIQRAVITVNGDTLIENDETLTVTLSNLNASGRSVTFATSTATGTILNDEYDFGDAPDGAGFLTPNTYPTRLVNNGAFHVVNASLSPRLGATIDTELDGQPNAAAAGDGTDEDGVTFTSPILRSADTALPAAVDVDVTLAAAAATTTYLSAWIDFNNDGSFSGAGEQIATDLQVVAGTTSIMFDVPAGAASVAGETFARFRISTLQGLTAGGFGGAGEVEDYLVTIQDSSSIPLDMTFTGPAGGDDLELLVIGSDTVIRRFEDNTELFRRNSALITSLTIIGASNLDDSLTVNFANGSPLPAGGTSFIGGSGGTDILSFANTGSLFNASTINITGRASGTASFVAGANTFNVNFTSVDSATSDFRGSDLTIALPNSSDAVTIRDDGNSSNGRFILSSSTDTLPSLLLSSPSRQFTLKGRSGDDSINVTSLDSAFAAQLIILGGSGSDSISLLSIPVEATLLGGGGNDTLIGGSRNDLLIGGTGDDVLEGNKGSDVLDGRDGNDTMRGANGTDSLTGGRGDDRLFGNGGTTVIVETIDADISFTTLTNQITSSSSTLGSDVISGDGRINAVLTGTSAANNIDASGLVDAVTIDGGGGNDTLSGTGADDVLTGGNGTDRLRLSPTVPSRISSTQVTGSGTDDITGIEVIAVIAGADPINLDATGFGGRLLVTGSPGSDTVIGGAGNDRINGKAGDDVLTGGAGDDSILAGNGNDIVSGNLGNDVLRGQGGDDILDGGPDNDLIDGGAGSNTLRIAIDADITITSSDSQATVTGAGNDTLTGTFANVSIQTGASNNRIDVSRFTGSVSIVAGAGDDTILGTDNPDTVDGGLGSDTFITSYIAASVTITNTESGHDSITGIELISATVERSAGSRVDASAFSGQVSLSGGAGSDTLIGTDNADTLLGGNGNDFLSGGNGPDRLSGGNGADVLDGGIGKDSILGQSGNDTITGGIGDDTLDGGADSDRLVENVSGDSTLTASLLTGNGTDVLESLFEAVVLQGGSGNDRLDASSYTRRVTLNGGAGDDTLLGGRDSDLLNGEDGIDLIRQAVNANQILRDTLVTGDGGDILSGIERAILIGGSGNNRIEASAFTGQVTLLGLDGDDTLFGSQGNDVISGGAGNDDLRGDAGDDTIDGGDGNDFVRGAIGNDVLLGGDGNDTLDGTDGMDTLLGESGRDRIDGGADVDAVTGGGNGIAPTNDFIVGSASEIDDALTFDFDSLIANI